MTGLPSLRLAFDVPDGASDGSTVAVLLHGRGSHGRDLLGLRPGLPADLVLVTPEAPHPAAPWGYGPGWAWYRYLGEDRLDETALEISLAGLDGVLDRLGDELGFTPRRLILGGFSQGGTTGLAYALLRPGRVHGVMNLSGFLARGLLDRAEAGAAVGLPVFWGHGTDDPAIPHSMAQRGRWSLTEAGARLTTGDYPMGHGVAAEELADVTTWMEGLGE